MKRTSLLAVVLALTLCGTARAGLYTFTFDNGGAGLNAAIPDGLVTGYQTSQDLTGFTFDVPEISSLEVRLTLTTEFIGDLYGYLVLESGEDTRFAALLNRIGRDEANPLGYDAAGTFNITLSDLAATDIHVYGGGDLTGAWQPDGRAVDPATATTDSERIEDVLGLFSGANPNGTWTLFLADFSFGDQSTLVDWGLEIRVVPEPTTWSLGVLGLIGIGTQLAGRRRRRAAEKSAIGRD
jgi:subtilisin-like proprotein convertase family protein